jgi:uncharacterized protein YrrD
MSGDGRPAGRVADLVFSGRGERVIALLLQGGRGARRGLVPFEEVAAIGPAAVLLRRPVVLAARDGARLRGLRQTHAGIVGRRVLGKDGRDVGIVADVCFRPDGGEVTGFVVSQGFLGDIAHGQGFLPAEALREGRQGWLLVPPV